MRKTLLLAVACLSLLPITSSLAQDIYKWKDGSGNSHYSETPPASGAFTVQSAASSVPAPSSPSASASTTGASEPAQAGSAPGVDSRCDSARKNMVALQGKASVEMDTDGSGKRKVLSDAEKNSQLELNRATLKAYNCSEAASSS